MCSYADRVDNGHLVGEIYPISMTNTKQHIIHDMPCSDFPMVRGKWWCIRCRLWLSICCLYFCIVTVFAISPIVSGICHVFSVGEWQPIVVIEIFLRRHSVMSLKCIWLGVLQATLQWHHNERDGVSNHQPHGFLLNRLFKRRSEETSKLLVTGLYAGNSLLTVAFPAQRPITRKMFLFDDVVIKIMLPLSYQSLPTALSIRKIFFSYIYVSINVPE